MGGPSWRQSIFSRSTVQPPNSAGRFTWSDPGRIAAQGDLNARLVDAAAELGAMTLTVITGGTEGLAPGDARARIADGLAGLDATAGAAGVRLGLEPIHPVGLIDKGCINTLAQARAAIAGLPATGIMLDTYHSWWDPDFGRAVDSLPVALIQICNVVHPPGDAPRRSPALDEGLMDMPAVLRAFRAAGYAGPFEFEIFAPDHGRDDPRPLMAAAANAFTGMAA